MGAKNDGTTYHNVNMFVFFFLILTYSRMFFTTEMPILPYIIMFIKNTQILTYSRTATKPQKASLPYVIV